MLPRSLQRIALTFVMTLAFAYASAAHAAENVTEFFLDNGLQVVVIEDHRSPAVATHMLWYRAGAADEPPGVVRDRAFPRAPDVQGHRHELDERRVLAAVVEANGGSRQRLHLLGLHRLLPARRRRPPRPDDGDGGRPDAPISASPTRRW
jgi:hypothetical protein